MTVTQKLLKWGAKGLTLSVLRSSPNPISLLPNRPLGSETFIGQFMEYLGKTSAVANLQQLQASRNALITDILDNLSPAPDKVEPGWMKISYEGVSSIVPQMNINQSTATIQNNLYPKDGGTGFSVGLEVTKIDSNTVNVSADGGVSGSGWIDFFRFSAGGSASYNMFSFSESITTCNMSISFKGITKVTPSFQPYDISSFTGWWYPTAIQDAANHKPGSTGYQFDTKPPYNFANDGDFGVLANILIAQEPTFTLVYTDTEYSYFKEVFEEHSSWGVSFLGIPLFGGSQSYFHSTIKEDTTKKTVTIEIKPPAMVSPVQPLDQLAYVLGAQILWPGAE